MDLESFAYEAGSEGAVLLNAVQAEIGDDGFLQSYLEDAGVQVAHTGSDAKASQLCHDKVCLPGFPTCKPIHDRYNHTEHRTRSYELK